MSTAYPLPRCWLLQIETFNANKAPFIDLQSLFNQLFLICADQFWLLISISDQHGFETESALQSEILLFTTASSLDSSLDSRVSSLKLRICQVHFAWNAKFKLEVHWARRTRRFCWRVPTKATVELVLRAPKTTIKRVLLSLNFLFISRFCFY